MRIRVCLKQATAVLMALIWTVSVALAQGFTENPAAIEKAADSVFMLEVYDRYNRQIAVGSGFLAFDSGILVTNYHVIEDASYLIAVSDEEERSTISRACILDKQGDIAILKFDQAIRREPLEMETSEELLRAEKVVAIGSPAGLMNTISLGNISGFYKQNGKDWIQFTAPISSGSSGGALLNDEGKVIGVTTATYTSAQNVNMAVRARDVIALYRKWNGNTFAIDSRAGTASAHSATTQEKTAQQGTVYVTQSGTKYHSSPDCSKMKNPIATDLMTALEKGYTPCTKCFR